MNIKELKSYIESLPDNYKGIGIDSVNSWRGDYREPAFTFGESSKDEMLSIIDRCLSDEFEGYKGGIFTYTDHNDVHFDVYGYYTENRYFYGVLSENMDSEFFIGLIKAMAEAL